MALSPAIDAAKNQFAVKHTLNATDPRTLEAFFTHQVLLLRNLSDFAAELSWQQEKMILVGGDRDTQLDAIVILVNNEEVLRPGDSLEELEHAVSGDEPLQISFIFVQATGANIDDEKLTRKMQAFSDGVYNFLDPDASNVEGVNERLSCWIKLKNDIFQILEEANATSCCDCSMFFVSSRKILKDHNINRAVNTGRSKVLKHKDLSPLFYSVDFITIDGDRLERMIVNSAERRADLTVSVAGFVQTPRSDNVDACYFGYLTAKEVLAFISEGIDDNEGNSKARDFLREHPKFPRSWSRS